MNLTHRARPLVQSAVDRAFDAAVTWVKKSPMAYGLRNRRDFTSLQFHEVMLADSPRVNAYADALPRVVNDGDTVVDLGTGTGILAFLAARAGAGTVHAIDHSPIVDAAREVAQANGIDCVVFHQLHSTAFSPAEKVDVLVHEQMGDSLFEERMVTNVADLRDRVLKPGGAIVPALFDFFVEPVQLKEPFVVPMVSQQKIAGIDFSVLRHRVQAQPPRYRRFELPPYQFEQILSTPAPALGLDLHTISPADLPRSLEFERVIESAGTVHGLGVWFHAHLDAQSAIRTTPVGLASSSWKIPFLRLEEPLEVAPGDRLRIRLDAADLEVTDTWEWAVTRHPV